MQAVSGLELTCFFSYDLAQAFRSPYTEERRLQLENDIRDMKREQPFLNPLRIFKR